MTIAVFPGPLSPELQAELRAGGFQTFELTDVADLTERQPPQGWTAMLVELGDQPLRALSMRALSTARRAREEMGIPVILICSHESLIGLSDEFDDFVLLPLRRLELSVRLQRLIRTGTPEEILSFKDLELNTATYQARIGQRPVDLTYMEYELLRFFVTNPGRVWSREQLLSKVWGYDYFGGARTVDVHVRRLRAKLGEERASWITTVRSVGYRFA